MTDNRRVAEHGQETAELHGENGSGESQSHDDRDVPQRRGAAVRVQLRQQSVCICQRRRVRAQPSIEQNLPGAQEQEHAHPAVPDHSVHDDDGAHDRVGRTDAFRDGYHVRRAADPASGQGCEPLPTLQRQPAGEHHVGHLRPDHDSDRACRDHDECRPPEPEDALEVDRDHQQQ